MQDIKQKKARRKITARPELVQKLQFDEAKVRIEYKHRYLLLLLALLCFMLFYCFLFFLFFFCLPVVVGFTF